MECVPGNLCVSSARRYNKRMYAPPITPKGDFAAATYRQHRPHPLHPPHSFFLVSSKRTMEKKRARSPSPSSSDEENDEKNQSDWKKAKTIDPRHGTNDYSGWTPVKGDHIERVQFSDLTPESFFDNYVAKR